MAASAHDLLSDPLLRSVPTIAGYKVINSIALFAKVGQGGMGVVYRGQHAVLEVECAVKVLKPSLADEDPMFVQRLLREARVAAQLNHQNIVRLYDAGCEGGLHHLVMEFITGESVRARIERRGTQSEAEALAILAGAAAGLGEAHARGLVHRDVKPDNLLVATDGRVKVVDLGLVKNGAVGRHSVSLASGIMGTPQYMAPEQWESADVTAAADVWALGAVLWFLLTGEHAIEASSLAAVARRVQERDFPSLRDKRPDLRAEVHAVFDRCVARDPATRFADGTALAAALRPLLRGGEELLADPAAGSQASSAGLSTPPPRETLGKIRVELETPTRVGERSVDVFDKATVVSKEGAVADPAPTAKAGGRTWLAVAGLALAAVGGTLWFGNEAGWFDDPAQWEEAERVIRVRNNFADAERVLPEPGQLAVAIEKLRLVLDDAPDHTRGKTLLAAALDKRAEESMASDLDGAFVAAKEAVTLDPANAAIAQRCTAIENKLKSRLLFGLQIEEPIDDAVVDGDRCTVRGKVPPAVAAVTVVVWSRAADRSERYEAKVVAGGFEVVVPMLDAGDHYVSLLAQDRHGLQSGSLPNPIQVAGVVGARGTVPDPAAPTPRSVVTGAGVVMVPIPVRSFGMGTLDVRPLRDDDETKHTVVMTQPYWLAVTEVTRAQWRRVMDTSPWAPEGGADTAADALPATGIDWDAAVSFCERLTAREEAAGRLPADYRYCLPSEAQWELAALGGGQVVFPHGSGVAALAEHAVFGGEATEPERVATKTANAFGLFDMAGNVAEWCADFAMGASLVEPSVSYREGVTEPLELVGDHRIVRGGSFASPPIECRCASRVAMAPNTATLQLGFRPALAKR